MLKMKPGYNTNFFDDYVRENYIPKDAPLVKIKEFLDLDFIEPLICNSYKNDNNLGRDPIDPRTMFLICLLEYIEGFSDLKMEEKLRLTPLYRWFVDLCPTDDIPDASTISFFRIHRMGEEKFAAALAQTVKQLQEAGLVSGEIQSQDATDMRGDIAILNPMQLLDKCRRNLLRAVKKINKNKYAQLLKKYDFDLKTKPGNRQKRFEELIEITQGLVCAVRRSGKLLKDKNIQKELEILGRVLAEREDEYYDEEDKKQRKEDVDKITGKMINPVDPDASWGAKSDKKFFAGYKVSVNTDHKYGIVTEVEINKAGHPEEKSAAPMLEKQRNNLGIVPQHFTADAKYDFGNTRTELKTLGVSNIYIPLVPAKNKEGGLVWDNFYFESGHLFCPAGYPAERRFNDKRRLGFEFKFNADVCQTCELRSECTSAEYGRSVFVSHAQLERHDALSFNVSEQYELIYKEQHWKVEPKNADLKRYQGLRRARYRGKPRVSIQVYLATIASNFKKYVKFIMGKLVDGVISTLAKLPALAPPMGEVCPETG